MATGLLALLDDVAAIAKLAAASLDDVAAQTVKAGTKAAGVVIDDAAVTPRYVVGLRPERELPMIGKIALGSLFNKVVILLPLCLLLGYVLPGAMPFLLIIGGVYLAFEGTEKVYGAIHPHAAHEHENALLGEKTDPVALEKEKIKGAVLTDFILSAEIMALTLSQVTTSSFLVQIGVLLGVGVLITIAVYGFVGLLVKIDDIGLVLTKLPNFALQRVGHGLVIGMPVFLKLLAIVGTAAMLWVGGSILTHSLAQLGVTGPEHLIHQIAEGVAHIVVVWPAAVIWLASSLIQATLAIIVGAVIILGLEVIVEPVLSKLRPAKA